MNNNMPRAEIDLDSLKRLQETRERLGDNKDNWQWGALHHMKFKHPLYELADKQEKELLAFQEVSRGGSADTPNSTLFEEQL